MITKRDHSEWGTLLVPALKKDGNLRLCTYYKVTVNKYLKDCHYSMLLIEDWFSALQVIFVITFKINKLTCSTHKGLFALNSPCGTKSVCAKFQSITTLQGCDDFDILIRRCVGYW